VAIFDDGRGTSEAELRSAMRPGSRNPLEERRAEDLGRLGPGVESCAPGIRCPIHLGDNLYENIKLVTALSVIAGFQRYLGKH
jgi:hypothetical protein